MLSSKIIRRACLVTAIVVTSGVVWRLEQNSPIGPHAPEGQRARVVVSSKAREGSSKADVVPMPRLTTNAAPPIDGRSDIRVSGIVNNLNGARQSDGPFVVSASIVAACNDPGLNAVHFCKGLYADIAEMAKESRDATWAADMEEQLQEYVERDFKQSSIRNIECQTSWCVIEVISSDHPFRAVFSYPNSLNDKLNTKDWVTSTEKDPSGADLQVIVVTYKRR